MSNRTKFLYSFILFYIINLNLLKVNGSPLYKIAIDPGHGGKDSGGLSKEKIKGKKIKEKDIALQVAKKLKLKIISEIKHVSVIMTRESDKFFGLGERSRIINRNNPDLMITLHCNTCYDSRAKGCEIYLMGSKAKWPTLGIVADLKQANIRTMERNTATVENQVIFLDEDDKKDYFKNLRAPHSKILTNIFADANLRNSTTLANILKTNMCKKSIMSPVKVLEDGFLLLWKVVAPSIYLELGFLTNPNDLRTLTSEEGQNKIVNALVKSIKEYKNRLELEKNN